MKNQFPLSIKNCNSYSYLFICSLRKLACFEHCSVQIGDKSYYKIEENNQIKNLVLKKKQTPMHFLHKGDLALTISPSSKDKKYRDKKFQHEHEWDYVTHPEAGSDALETKQEADDPVDAKADNRSCSAGNKKFGTELDPSDAYGAGGVAKRERAIDPEEDASSTAVNIDGTDEQDDLEDGEYDDLDTDSESGPYSGESDTAEHAPTKKRRVRRGMSLKSRNLRKCMTKRSKKKQPPKEPRTYQAGELVSVEVVYTLSYVDVVWQVR
jgi:hypothetical protein